MKILLGGTFLMGYLELSLERYFKEYECQVYRLDIAKIIRDSTLYFLDKNPISRRLCRRYWEELINKSFIELFRKIIPDLVLVYKGYYICPDTIKLIRDSGKALIFCFNGDNPFNIDSPGVSNKNILDSIPQYDCYFIWTSSLIEPLFKAGARKVECLPFGFDPLLHYPVDLSETERRLYGNDIAFVGSWDKERERWLKEIATFDLGIWGEGYWKTHCKDKSIRNKWREMAVYGENMSKVLNASKVSLNILREQNKENHNMRTFEAPACGAFVLAERSKEEKYFFEEDKEAVYFSSPEELRDKIVYYLKHEEERKKIAKEGYKRCVSSEYSYFYRVKQILNSYKELSQYGRKSYA